MARPAIFADPSRRVIRLFQRRMPLLRMRNLFLTKHTLILRSPLATLGVGEGRREGSAAGAEVVL